MLNEEDQKKIDLIKSRLSKISGGWSLVEDETYCGGFGCTPDGCHGHSTGRGTWVDGPHIVEVFEGGMGETQEEETKNYLQACADAEFIADAETDIKVLLALVEKLAGETK